MNQLVSKICGSTCVLLLILALPASGQISTAQLTGKVTDTSNAVLPGATVTVIQTDTGAVRSVVTDADGSYLVSNLSPGPYRLEIALQGFRTYVQTGIVLQVAATPTINVSLALGNLQETITVEAAAPLVDVKSAGVSEVVESERIVELPLQGRDVTALLVAAGAAVNTGSPNSRSFAGGVNVAVAGGLPFGVAYLLDGAMHNDSQNNANLPLPFPDALQEFRVATTGLTAQNGMHSGASVNAITKSGTNRFSGNLFEFNRDSRFNAIDPFAKIVNGKQVDDGLSRNQWGGTAGGPLVHDRLFFFGAYQGTNQHQVPQSIIAFVPTDAMLRGDFRDFASAECNGGTAVQLRAPFAGNQINPALFSPAALKLVSYLPKADDQKCGQVTYGLPWDRKMGQAVGRLDYQLSQRHSIFGRYMATFDKSPSPFATTNNILTLAGSTTPSLPGAGVDNLAQSATGGMTTVLGANFVNAVRVAFNRTSIHRGTPPFFDPVDLGVKNFYSYRDDETVIAVNGGFNLSAATSTTGVFWTNSYQAADDLTLVKGRHQFGFGASVAYWKSFQTSHARSGGSWMFNGTITGRGLADLMVGAVGSLEHGVPNLLVMDMPYFGIYGQDAWRIGDRVTLNYGLRWEPYLGQQMLYGGASIFDHDNFVNGVKSQVFVNAPAGLLYPGDPGFPEGKSGYNVKWLDVSPRLGLAWDVTGDGRLAFRTSYGLTYDFPSGDYMNINASAPPWGNRSLITTTVFDDPYSVVGGNPHPIATNRNTMYPAFGAFGVMDPDINPPRVQSWNVTLEKQFGTNWAATVNYLGRYSDHLWAELAVNPGVFMGLGPCTLNGVAQPVCSTIGNLNQRRKFTLENPTQGALLGFVDEHNDVGWQKYNGLRFTGTRRSATGLTLSGNYTLSHCVGTATPGSFPQIASGYTNPDDPDMDKGHCDQDRTHLANITAGYQTPELANKVLRIIASNWRVTGIYSARSGQWLNITTGVDNALNGQLQQRPNKVSDDVYGPKTLNNYLNRAAFGSPTAGTFGNLEYRAVEGPAFWQIDAGFSRLIDLGSTRNLELRIEAFNLTNHFNWGNPPTNLAQSQFGRIQTNGGFQRIMQFGVKYSF
jgi:Carboxypeptidase regulatory-like domain